MTHTRDARRDCVPVTVDGVIIGGQAPIAVQSMTNTLTADVERTVTQVQTLSDAGSDLVRITVDTEEAASAVGAIRRKLDATGYDVPLIGDFHYNGHRLLAKFPDCAASLSKYRINPGNVGQGAKRDIQFAEMISIARHHRKPIRSRSHRLFHHSETHLRHNHFRNSTRRCRPHNPGVPTEQTPEWPPRGY